MASEPKKSIRIGGASGYWGDSNAAPAQLVDRGDIDYLVFDYLAEVTMAIPRSSRAARRIRATRTISSSA